MTSAERTFSASYSARVLEVNICHTLSTCRIVYIYMHVLDSSGATGDVVMRLVLDRFGDQSCLGRHCHHFRLGLESPGRPPGAGPLSPHRTKETRLGVPAVQCRHSRREDPGACRKFVMRASLYLSCNTMQVADRECSLTGDRTNCDGDLCLCLPPPPCPAAGAWVDTVL